MTPLRGRRSSAIPTLRVRRRVQSARHDPARPSSHFLRMPVPHWIRVGMGRTLFSPKMSACVARSRWIVPATRKSARNPEASRPVFSAKPRCRECARSPAHRHRSTRLGEFRRCSRSHRHGALRRRGTARCATGARCACRWAEAARILGLGPPMRWPRTPNAAGQSGIANSETVRTHAHSQRDEVKVLDLGHREDLERGETSRRS
jgi:hypothetical protein